MDAAGICWKRGRWVFSVYRLWGDAYPTLKVRKVRVKRGATKKDAAALNVKVEVGRCLFVRRH